MQEKEKEKKEEKKEEGVYSLDIRK